MSTFSVKNANLYIDLTVLIFKIIAFLEYIILVYTNLFKIINKIIYRYIKLISNII